MSPIREYICNYCNHQFEEVVMSADPDEYKYIECRCGSRAKLLPSLIGGYYGNTGGSSTRPKGKGTQTKTKAYTGIREDLSNHATLPKDKEYD